MTSKTSPFTMTQQSVSMEQREKELKKTFTKEKKTMKRETFVVFGHFFGGVDFLASRCRSRGRSSRLQKQKIRNKREKKEREEKHTAVEAVAEEEEEEEAAC